LATRVTFAIPEREIENTGITFKRRVDAAMYGEITVHQNHITWRPKNHKFVYRISWDVFADCAKKYGKHLRPKASVVRAKKKLKPAGV
jgi:hypothetical protein